jgi:hypothetical protein
MTNLYRIFVPSTKNESESINKFEHAERVKQTFVFLSNLNGGATTLGAYGGWTDDNDNIIGEDVTIVESFGDIDALDPIKQFCENAKIEWLQNCIGLQVVPCNMYFV